MAVLAATATEDSATRLKRERAELRSALAAKCPSKRATIDRLEGASAEQTVELLTALEACGAKNEAYFVQLGNALQLTNRFTESEAGFRKALAVRVTESAQLGLLTSLVRQKVLKPEQKADLEENLRYFRQHPCTRDDLCASLSYVAWHVEEIELVKQSAERAIQLGFPGWQPYFTAGTVYSNGSDADRAQAVKMLREAKKRGGPAKDIDEFLSLLGAAGP